MTKKEFNEMMKGKSNDSFLKVANIMLWVFILLGSLAVIAQLFPIQ